MNEAQAHLIIWWSVSPSKTNVLIALVCGLDSEHSSGVPRRHEPCQENEAWLLGVRPELSGKMSSLDLRQAPSRAESLLSSLCSESLVKPEHLSLFLVLPLLWDCNR